MKLPDSSIIDLIRSIDPAPGSPTPSTDVLKQRAAQLTTGVTPKLPTQQARWRWPVRPLLIAAAGVAALALVIPALIPDSAPQAKAVTPPVLTFAADARNGQQLLRSMAAKLRKEPSTPQTTRSRGGVVSIDGYSLSTSVPGDGHATSAWFSKKITTDVQLDGVTNTGTTRVTSEESEPHFANEEDRKAWVDSGAGGGAGRRSTTEPTAPETAAWYTQPALNRQAFLNRLFNRQPDQSTGMFLNGFRENLETQRARTRTARNPAGRTRCP